MTSICPRIFKVDVKNFFDLPPKSRRRSLKEVSNLRKISQKKPKKREIATTTTVTETA
jgi:hypothetical protein